MSENQTLNNEISEVQENLRLSASQLSKINNQLKIVCNENDELKKRLNDAADTARKSIEYESKVSMLTQEVERLTVTLEKKTVEIRNLSQNTLQTDAVKRQLKSATDQYKKLTGENENLYAEIREGQEQLRLSANKLSRLQGELDRNTSDNEELRRKIK